MVVFKVSYFTSEGLKERSFDNFDEADVFIRDLREVFLPAEGFRRSQNV